MITPEKDQIIIPLEEYERLKLIEREYKILKHKRDTNDLDLPF